MKLFPPNKENQIMKTKNHQYFSVFKANTTRLQASTILYTLNLLNKEIKEFSKIKSGVFSQSSLTILEKKDTPNL